MAAELRDTRHVPQSVMIARDNEQRDKLNHAAREHFKTYGLLGAEHDYGGTPIAVGDRIICRRNDRLVDVDNGTRGTVTQLDARGITIDTDDGHTRELPPPTSKSTYSTPTPSPATGCRAPPSRAQSCCASPGDLDCGMELHRALPCPRQHTPAHPP